MGRGRERYETGVAGTGAIACQDCPSAAGASKASFPTLAGQHGAHLVHQFQAFASGVRASGPPMHCIARDLPRADADPLGAYLQSL
jgi:cytochrome c553